MAHHHFHKRRTLTPRQLSDVQIERLFASAEFEDREREQRMAAAMTVDYDPGATIAGTLARAHCPTSRLPALIASFTPKERRWVENYRQELLAAALEGEDPAESLEVA